MIIIECNRAGVQLQLPYQQLWQLPKPYFACAVQGGRHAFSACECATLHVPFLIELLACFLVPSPQDAVHKQVGAVCLHKHWFVAGFSLHVGDRGHGDRATGHHMLQRVAAVD